MENSCVVDTVIFDMGGVIFENGTKNVILKLVNDFGIEIDIAENIFMGPDSWTLRAGKIDSEIYWDDIYKKYHSLPLLQELDLQLMWYNEFKIKEGMKDLIKKLNYKYRVGVVSGNIRDRVDFLISKYGLENLFHFQAYSFDYGLQKNESELYSRIIVDHSIEPLRTIIIDDNVDCLQAAAKMGLNTILFSNINDLYMELSNYGLRSSNS